MIERESERRREILEEGEREEPRNNSESSK